MFRHLLSILVGASLVGCGSGKPDHSGLYVGGDETALMQLQIVEQENGTINGSISVNQLDYAAGELKLTTKAISGIRRADQFSLLAHGGGLGAADAPLALEAKQHSLFLKVPATGQTVELVAMNQDQYRERLNEFAKALTANDVGLIPDN